MFHTCNIGVLHMYKYMCNTGVYPTHVLEVYYTFICYICNTPVFLHNNVIHLKQHICINGVAQLSVYLKEGQFNTFYM